MIHSLKLSGVFLISLLISATAMAKDLGFRFESGGCRGLNPGYIGQCGDMRGVTLSRVDFRETDLSGTVFEGSDLQLSLFGGANLTAVSFVGANLSGVELMGTTLTGAKFARAILLNAHFAGANLSGLDFSGADFTATDLSFISLTGANLTGANFTDAMLESADLSGAQLGKAKLAGAKLISANLSSAHLEGADVSGVDMSSAKLIGVFAKGLQARSTFFRRADLSKGDFSEGNLRSAQLQGAKLDGANFEKANLNSASLKGGSVKATKFSGATFNRRTELPFAADEAEKQGMLSSKAGTLLIIWDTNVTDPNLLTLTKYLDAQGIEQKFSKQAQQNFDGTEDLNDYTAVLHLLGNSENNDMPLAGQQAIMDFVRNGGTYMATAWAGYMYDRQKLQALKDCILINYDTGNTGAFNFKPTPGQESHPLLEGLEAGVSINGGYNIGPVLKTFSDHPAQSLMIAEGGAQMVAIRDVGAGHAINFGFAATYSTFPMFESEGIRRLILNGVNFN